jgi:hypothetical protein
MARQVGDIRVQGEIDGISYYEMGGRHYARRKSSLTGKRFHKEAAFEGSRRSSSRFGKGNELAGLVYRGIAPGLRCRRFYGKLMKMAVGLLKEGLKEEEVLLELRGLARGRERIGRLRAEARSTLRGSENFAAYHLCGFARTSFARYGLSKCGLVKGPGLRLVGVREKLRKREVIPFREKDVRAG